MTLVPTTLHAQDDPATMDEGAGVATASSTSTAAVATDPPHESAAIPADTAAPPTAAASEAIAAPQTQPLVKAATARDDRVGPSGDTIVGKGKNKEKKAKRKLEKINAAKAEGELEFGDPWGDAKDELSAAGLSFRFLVQAQYQQTIAKGSRNPDETYRVAENTLAHDGDGWGVNRFFFRVIAKPNRHLELKLITDFAEFSRAPKRAVKQAYFELKPVPSHFHVLAGIVKLPFSILELDPVSKYELADMGKANDLATNLDFAGRDVGGEVMLAPFSKPRYLELVAGVFGGHAKDEHSSVIGSVGGRIETRAIKGLRFGLDCVIHPKSNTYLKPFDAGGKELLPNPENPAYPRARTWSSGRAYSADVTFSRDRLMLRTEALLGTRVDVDTRYGAERWGAVWGIAAYRFPAGPVHLQPALRAEWLDTDLDHDAGLRRQLSAAVAVYFSKATRLLADVTRTDVQPYSPVLAQPEPLREVPYVALDDTRITGQIQVDL
jgi:hypothetical protein